MGSILFTMELVREKLDFFVEEKDLQSFRRAFEIFDSDGSGKINVDEMDKHIIELTTHDPTEEEVKQIIKEFDADESGKVEFKEFVRVMAKKAENAKIMEKEEEFRKAFEMFDRDGNGKISSAELRHVLTKTGRMKLTEEEVTEMIAEVDEDQDGKINFNELVKLFTGADSIRDLVT